MQKLKIGIIGTGGISECHIEGYKKHPDVELYAFCDINRERVEAKAAKHGIPLDRCFTDVHAMLRALPEIEAVSVCTWNSAHAACTIAALKAGKHVLCEKPMALNAHQAAAMQAAAAEHGTFLMEIKTLGAIPCWLAHLLSGQDIYTQSFSKYGNVYQNIACQEGMLHAG